MLASCLPWGVKCLVRKGSLHSASTLVASCLPAAEAMLPGKGGKLKQKGGKMKTSDILTNTQDISTPHTTCPNSARCSTTNDEPLVMSNSNPGQVVNLPAASQNQEGLCWEEVMKTATEPELRLDDFESSMQTQCLTSCWAGAVACLSFLSKQSGEEVKKTAAEPELRLDDFESSMQTQCLTSCWAGAAACLSFLSKQSLHSRESLSSHSGCVAVELDDFESSMQTQCLTSCWVWAVARLSFLSKQSELWHDWTVASCQCSKKLYPAQGLPRP